jgi:hypothetical protein
MEFVGNHFGQFDSFAFAENAKIYPQTLAPHCVWCSAGVTPILPIF